MNKISKDDINTELDHLITKLDEILIDNQKVFSEFTTLRIIPDYRDGLKTVQRRILFAMLENKVKNFVKSMKVVGEVIGKYHPHGDLSVYGAMTKLCQWFNHNLGFLIPQGNFGSIDGFPAASARYTELRLDNSSEDILFKFLYKVKQIIWLDNFDNTRKEPLFLPSLLPMSLINGVFSIAVGVACNIPPHNTIEIIDSLIYVLENYEQDVTVNELMNIIKGPDFPTKGQILNVNFTKIYEQGRGSFKVRGKIEEHDNKLIITEIPYGVTLNSILSQLGEERKQNTNLREIIDASDAHGIKVEINLNKFSVPSVVKERLFKCTNLEKIISLNMVLLNNNTLKYYNLGTFFQDFKKYIVNLYTENFNYELKLKKNHIEDIKLQIWAAENAEQIINIIQKNNTDPKNELITRYFDKTPQEIEKILNFKLYRLASFEILPLKQKILVLENEILEIYKLLDNQNLLIQHIILELGILKFKYGNERKTEICLSFEKENIDVLLVLVDRAFILKIPFANIKKKNLNTKSNDYKLGLGKPEFLIKTTEFSYIYLFTDTAKFVKVLVSSLAFGIVKNLSEMKDLSSFLTPNEKFVDYINNDTNFKYIFFITKLGKVMKLLLSDLIRSHQNIPVLNLSETDKLVKVFLANDEHKIFICTLLGKISVFNQENIRVTKKKVRGVKGLSLDKDDSIIDGGICFQELFIFTKNGKGKGVKIDTIHSSKHRGGKGVKICSLSKVDNIIKIVNLNESESKDLVILTKKGEFFKTGFNSINFYGRNAKGHGIINLDPDDSIINLVF